MATLLKTEALLLPNELDDPLFRKTHFVNSHFRVNAWYQSKYKKKNKNENNNNKKTA